jgi:hypothetical protein
LRIVIRAAGFNVVVNEKGLSGAMMRFDRGRFDDGLFERADELADTTDAGPLGQWLIGVVLAALVGVYAVDCLVTGRAAVPSHRWPNPFTEAEGLAATALGVLYLCIALFMHLHFFWTASPRFYGYAQLGKLIATAGTIGSVGLYYFAVFQS